MLFLLNKLLSSVYPKCLSTRRRNNCATLVCTFLLNGGLNYILSRSVSFPSLTGLGIVGVLNVLVVSACPEGLVVNFCCVVKVVSVRRQSRYSPANGARDLFYDRGWVVGLGIDVERIIAWLSVGVVLSGLQVERNIQVAHHL